MRLVRKSFKCLKPLGWEEGKTNYRQGSNISLLFGENFVPIDKKIKSSIIKELDKLNIYPEAMGNRLIKKLSGYLRIPKNKILVANGIDDILNLIAKTFIEMGDETIIPTPTFPIYESTTKLMGGKVIRVKLKKNFKLDIDKLLNKVNKKTKVIFIANPNNPTGNTLVEIADVEKILKIFRGLLVIDECYYGICDVTLMNLIKKYDNLLILRSFSKSFGLAGLRVGYAIGSTNIISPMKSVLNDCNPFVLDRVAQAAAVASIDCEKKIIAKFKKLKSTFYKKLIKIKKLKVFPSETTFFLIDLKNTSMSAEEFRKRLTKKKIIIKDCSVYGLSNRFTRIPVPREKDLNYVVSSIRDIIYSQKK